MKRIIITCLVFAAIFVGNSNAQTSNLYSFSGSNLTASSAQELIFTSSLYAPNDTHLMMPMEDYAKKAHTQKVVAWVLAGAGVGLMTTGLIVAGKKKDDLSSVADDTVGGAVLITTGAVIGLVSIPFFIMSSKNKKKAGMNGKIMLQPIYASVPGAKAKLSPGIGINLKF